MVSASWTSQVRRLKRQYDSELSIPPPGTFRFGVRRLTFGPRELSRFPARCTAETPESENTESPGSELDRGERLGHHYVSSLLERWLESPARLTPENAMKIVYDISSKDVVRMDAIVLAEGEFPTCSPRTLAFRGDDRPPSNIFSS